MSELQQVAKVGAIQQRILFIRGEKVIIDADLAEAYKVTTKALNQAVRRNSSRFPADFMFQLSSEEKEQVVTNCDHLEKLKFSSVNPYAFTEHGAIMAASVLKFQGHSGQHLCCSGLCSVAHHARQQQRTCSEDDRA